MKGRMNYFFDPYLSIVAKVEKLNKNQNSTD